MPIAPARLEQARKLLLKTYTRTGGMPSVKAFAKAMGYSSTGSAFEVTEALVKEGFLAKNASGRLLPGKTFQLPTVLVPPEMLAMLPPGTEFKVLRMPDASLADAGVLEGDCLVAAPALTVESGHLVLSKGKALTVSSEPLAGWKVEGYLVAQFRSYW
jgi:SOS-response transcriptional repressor LexA